MNVNNKKSHKRLCLCDIHLL